MTGRFIGIDFSTTACGIAISDGATWETVTVKSSPSGRSLGDYYDRITDHARNIITAGRITALDTVGIEGIAFAGRGGSVDRLHYAWHRTVEALIRVIEVDPLIVTTNQVKQLATGRGNAQKDDVLLATERRIPEARVRGNDEADAVWVAVGASILAGSPVINLPAAHMPKAFTKGTAA